MPSLQPTTKESHEHRHRVLLRHDDETNQQRTTACSMTSPTNRTSPTPRRAARTRWCLLNLSTCSRGGRAVTRSGDGDDASILDAPHTAVAISKPSRKHLECNLYSQVLNLLWMDAQWLHAVYYKANGVCVCVCVQYGAGCKVKDARCGGGSAAWGRATSGDAS